MTGYEKEVQKTALSLEEKVLKQLERTFKQASDDLANNIAKLSARTDFENLQSIIYQQEYQEALKKQIDDALKGLQSKSYTTIDAYLKECYFNGYTGTMWSLSHQGLPAFVIPIDQEAVIRAIQLETNLSRSLYGSLGVAELKSDIKTELSRGIANGSTWAEIAEELRKSKPMKIVSVKKAMNRAMRIARTEGHRVQQEGHLDACRKAEKKGANIMKQWDSTLDSKTRPTHQELDGQIVGVEEYFHIPSNGKTGLAPSKFGDPAEDCNCRCCLLQRAKWALNEKELDVLKERAEYFGLDKSKNFEDFRRRFLELPKDAEIVNIDPNETFEGKIDAIRERISKQGYATESDLKEAGELVKSNLGFAERKAKFQDAYDEAKKNKTIFDDRLRNLKEEINALTEGYEFDPWEAFVHPETMGFKDLTAEQLAELKRIKDIREKIWNSDEYKKICDALKVVEKNMRFDGTKSAENLKSVLSRIRKMGHDDVESGVVKSRSVVRKAVVDALNCYPESWIEKAIKTPIEVKKTSRGYSLSNLIAISGETYDSQLETAFHELGHFFEWGVKCGENPLKNVDWSKAKADDLPKFIYQAESLFYDRRTAGEKLKWLGSGYAKSEKTREDNFIHEYMGKDYGGSNFELVSMGFEYAYTDPYRLEKDPDMESWIYGILALYE